jgi:hypothetical protein
MPDLLIFGRGKQNYEEFAYHGADVGFCDVLYRNRKSGGQRLCH